MTHIEKSGASAWLVAALGAALPLVAADLDSTPPAALHYAVERREPAQHGQVTWWRAPSLAVHGSGDALAHFLSPTKNQAIAVVPVALASPAARPSETLERERLRTEWLDEGPVTANFERCPLIVRM